MIERGEPRLDTFQSVSSPVVEVSYGGDQGDAVGDNGDGENS